MKTKRIQSGLSLIEMSVIIAVIALLVSFSVPAVRAFMKSFETEAGARGMISAALSSARAIALRDQKYAGIRFQNAYNPESGLKAAQYMIFIVYDPELPHSQRGNLGCRAIKGLKPIRLPDSVGVMDLRYRADLITRDNGIIDGGDEISNPIVITDTTTFSVLFSPSGKLTIHKLWVRNRNGANDDISTDDVFNTLTNLSNGIGAFRQDESGSTELGVELSRNNFIIYDRIQFNKTDVNRRWTDYLSGIKPVYINAYTGTIVSQD